MSNLDNGEASREPIPANPILESSREIKTKLEQFFADPRWEFSPKTLLNEQAQLVASMVADITREFHPAIKDTYVNPTPEEQSELQELLLWAQEKYLLLQAATNKRDLKF